MKQLMVGPGAALLLLIARAFFVPEATMAQRISSAKQTIRASGVPFRMPADDQRAARLRAVPRGPARAAS